MHSPGEERMAVTGRVGDDEGGNGKALGEFQLSLYGSDLTDKIQSTAFILYQNSLLILFGR